MTQLDLDDLAEEARLLKYSSGLELSAQFLALIAVLKAARALLRAVFDGGPMTDEQATLYEAYRDTFDATIGVRP